MGKASELRQSAAASELAVDACPSTNDLATMFDSRAALRGVEPLLAHLDACETCREAVAAMAGARSQRFAPPAPEPSGPSDPAERSDFAEPGGTVGRYVILHAVGAGGMGVVYAAYDPSLDRKVALKLVRPGLRASTAQLSQEAHALARVSHPNVVAVHDVGTHFGQLYLVMEFVQGETLRTWAHREPRTPADVLRVLVAAGEGLAAAHRVGLVHRDVKPENIMVDEALRARVTDFGLAHRVALDDKPLETRRMAGTLPYMAPEQLRGEPADAASDQFSLAVTAVEALTGRRPFSGTTRQELLEAMTRGPRAFAWKTTGNGPPALPGVLARALDPDPSRRFPTLEAFLAALAPRRASRVWLAVAVAAAVLLASATGVAVERRHATSLPVCRGGEQKLASVWDPARAGAVGRAFDDVPVPYAKDAWTATRPMLETYAAAWVHAYTDSCETTRIRKEQSEAVMDEQMACLYDRRRQLDALVTELAHPNVKTVDHAAQAAGELATPESCLDARTSRAPHTYLDPALTARATALADRVSRLRSQVEVGNEAAARDDVAAALLEARLLGDRRLEAETLLVQWRVFLASGHAREALDALLESARVAEADRDDDLVADARVHAIEVSSNELFQTTEAEAYAAEADAAVERVGAPPRLHASVLVGRGLIAFGERDYDRAITYGEDALRLDAQAVGSMVLSSAHSLIGSSLEDEHRSSEAIEHFRASLVMLERLLGPAHPTVARGVLNVGLAELSLHRYREAVESLERAMATFRAAGLDHGNDWLVVLPNMASTECELGDTEAGLRFASEALTAAGKEAGEDVREDVVGAYGVTGDCLVKAKQFGPARDAYTSGLAALRAGEVSPGDVEHENELETGLGTVELETGRAGDAVRRFERIARAQHAAGEATDPEQVAEVSFKLARALALLHREPGRARSLAEDARRVYAEESSPEEAKLAEIDAFLAAESSGER